MKMFNFFKKKIALTSLKHYMSYIDCNPYVKFQLDIYCNDIVDVQVFSSNHDLPFSVMSDYKNHFVIMMAFTKHLKNRDVIFDEFRNSKLFVDSKKVTDIELEDRYYYLVEKKENSINLHEVLIDILSNIYGYNKTTIYYLIFTEYLKDGSFVNVEYVDKHGKRIS